MSGWKIALLALGAAIVAHLATIFAAPFVLMDAAIERISRDGAMMNQWIHPPRTSEESRRVVRPSPDLAYSACVYDLKDGPLHVTASAWDDYMSVSVFAANSDNIFVQNDRQAPNGVEFILVRRGQPAPETQLHIVESPSDRGIILQRRVAPTEERFAMADAARRDDVCGTIAR